MKKRIGIYGLTRSGKTYIIEQICQSIPNTTHFKGSDTLFELSGCSIEEFRECDSATKDKYRRLLVQSAQKLFEESDKSVLIDGHYSFVDSEGNFEVVMTDEDEAFYDVICYINIDEDIIIKRVQETKDLAKQKTYSKAQLHKWKSFEMNCLEDICLRRGIEFIVLDNDVPNVVAYFKEILLDNSLLDTSSTIARFIDDNLCRIESTDAIILSDCDRTLSLKDHTFDVLKELKGDKSVLKNIFWGDNYSSYSFFKSMKMYSAFPIENYIQAAEIHSKDFPLNWKLIDQLKQLPNILVIGVTSGIHQLWKNVFKNNDLDFLLLGGTHDNFDSYIVSKFFKGQLAKALKPYNKPIIAIGDSLVDFDMLVMSDVGVIVANEKLNHLLLDKLSVSNAIENIRQLDSDTFLYDNTIKINHIQEVLNQDVICSK